MVDGQHKLSRRALLGAVCASPLLPSSRRKPGPQGDPLGALPSGIPDQVRDDEDSFVVTIWDRALARFHEARTILDTARSEPDQDRYDALLDAHTDALSTLLALPAPDLAAIAAKLEIIVPHLAWELTGAEDCLEILRQDAHRLAATMV